MAILNLPNTAFRAELAARGGAAADGDGDELDIPLRGADSPGELTAITERIPRLAERGAIWVVSRKGPAAG